jgi:bifunctional DNase/RNase
MEGWHMISVHVERIVINAATHEQMVKLTGSEESVHLMFQVDGAKGDALLDVLEGRPNPIMDDLLKVGEALESVQINQVSGDDFFAEVKGEIIPAIDAVLIATHLKIPIYVTDEVIEQAGVRPPKH